MTMTAATLPQSDPVTESDARLRRARELLDAGRLAPASAAGWQAALSAMAAHAGRDDGGDGATGCEATSFKETARRLLKDHRGDDNPSEWVFSALALADNAKFDWLGQDGISRRLDDVQRLLILLQDIANPPQTAADIFQQARVCLDNGYLAVASEKGWQAVLSATKTYADAVGCEYRGEYHFEQAIKRLAKEDARNRDVMEWEAGAASLGRTASYCAVYPDWLHPEIVAGDLASVANLVNLIDTTLAAMPGRAG